MFKSSKAKVRGSNALVSDYIAEIQINKHQQL